MSRWRLDNITDIRGFIRSCTNLTALDTRNWTLAAGPLVDTFAQDATSLTSSINPNAFWLNTRITSFDNAFSNATNIANFASIPAGWS